MPIATSIADLSTTAGSNYPSGSDSPSTLDDVIRNYGAFIALLRDGLGSFTSGTKLAFPQAAAPTGWVQITDDTADNRMLRVVKTAGGGVAGSHSPILNNVVPSHTHTFTTDTKNLEHTHSDSGHNHPVPANSGGYTGTDAPLGRGLHAASTQLTDIGFAQLGGMSQNVTHNHSGTTAANGSASNWTPRYIDMIVCQKS